jgi:glycosyltransferase involved in cell wall biosynthesis
VSATIVLAERPAVPTSGLADAARADGVVCFAAVDWWYHNRGHSECQIMSRLARRGPVLWVNSLGMRAPSPGKTELVLHRYARKLKSTVKGLRRDPDTGMWVYSPLFVPRYDNRTVELNARLVGAQVSLLCRYLGIERPAVWATIPTAAPIVERGRWSASVFNRSDEFSAFPEADAAFVAPLEQRLLRAADDVVYVNRSLLERERSVVRRPHFLGPGLDFTHFAGARPGHRPPADIPTAIKDLPRPIVGFYGALDDYTVDLELLVKTARHVAPATLLVIGPKAMDISRLLAEPNVVYLGAVPYADLPRHAAQFDVALMPWLRNEWIAGCNPIKLKEYLALGFPVVSTDFAELAQYDGLVHTASDHDSFLAAVTRALTEDDPGLGARRREAVCDDSWDALADFAASMLGIAGVAT